MGVPPTYCKDSAGNIFGTATFEVDLYALAATLRALMTGAEPPFPSSFED